MLQTIFEMRVLLQGIVIVILAVACFWRGAWPEKIVGGVLLGQLVSDKAYHLLTGNTSQLQSVDLWHFILDAVACLVLVALALNANRMYTLWIGSLQILSTTAHLVRELVDSMTPIAYAVMNIAPSYLMIGILIGGLWRHRIRVRKYGEYRAWRPARQNWAS